MKKLINFCKKPLLIISLVGFVIFMVSLITVCAIPHGKEYKYEYAVAGQEVESEITFKKNQIMVNTWLNETLQSSTSWEYKIKNGKLYAITDGETEYLGKISSFKIKIVADSGVEGYNNYVYVYKCKSTIAIRKVSIAFMCLFGVCGLASVVLTILDKKGIIKFKKEQLDNTETNIDNQTIDKVADSDTNLKTNKEEPIAENIVNEIIEEEKETASENKE